MSGITIENCFDSHLHWVATGNHHTRLLLNELKSPEDVSRLRVEEQHYLGEWLVGFGWDENKWSGREPHRKYLDAVFPDIPVAFSRADGHAAWVNTQALIRAGLIHGDQGQLKPNVQDIKGGKIVVDDKGLPTGVLVDLAKSIVDKIIPKPSPTQLQSYLLKGAMELNKQGFTHIRDLTCSEAQWEQACHIDENGILTLAVEQYFDAEDPHNFDRALKLAIRARKNQTPNLRAAGIKIYFDGALGSEGALLSQPYSSGSGYGLELLDLSQLKTFMQQTWEHEFDIAIHTIGDEAAHRTVTVAVQLWDSGYNGRLHLEHAELLRPDTIKLMKDRNIVCHMQPCHWLSDKQWIGKKLGDLQKYVFPWRALEQADIAFDFGSDSPIEPPCLRDNLAALKDAEQAGIENIKGDPLVRHSYPDRSWTPSTYTVFDEGQIKNVIFRGKHLF